MKNAELIELNYDELQQKLKDLKQQLYSLRFNHATGQLSNPKQLTVCKKDIARVMTVIRRYELEGKTQSVAKLKKSGLKGAKGV